MSRHISFAKVVVLRPLLPVITAALGLAALIFILASPARLALAYPVTPDGDSSDWVMTPPGLLNLGHIGRDAAEQGAYI